MANKIDTNDKISDGKPAAQPLLACRGLCHNYHRAGQSIAVLKDLNLTVDRGEFIALMGPSGSGKTTLLNLLGGLDAAQSGSIIIQGVDVHALSASTLAAWRAQNVGFIFQFYNLLPVLGARANVELPLLLTPLSARARRRRADIALELVGLADRARHKPAELSGGQQQRVAIARAIVTDPGLLVCDEPTGDLDRANADDILKLLKQLSEQQGKTIIMVTHDPKAAAYSDRLLHMDKGSLLTNEAQQAGERA